MSNNSIFREKRIFHKNYDEKFSNTNSQINIVTHDLGVARAREYSLSSKLNFSEYSGYTIKLLIETDFNYFIWFPRNIENFKYDKDVLDYAKKCLIYLEEVEIFKHKIFTKRGYIINQVSLMIEYEYNLDFKDDPLILDYFKSEINEKFYQTIINTSSERLIRQAFQVTAISNEYRRKYFNEIISTI